MFQIVILIYTERAHKCHFTIIGYNDTTLNNLK